MGLFGIKWNPLKDITKFFEGLFSAPKVTLPTIPTAATKVAEPLPLLEPADGSKAARKKGRMDVGSFSTNLTPSIQAILGLSIPKVSPGLMIPGGNSSG